MGWPLGWTSLEPLTLAAFAEWRAKVERGECWEFDPSTPAEGREVVPRVYDFSEHRVNRLKALGNGQVPQTAARAWIELQAREGWAP